MRMKHGSGRGEATSAKPRLLAAFTAVAMMFATAVPALMPKTAVAASALQDGATCTPQDVTIGSFEDNLNNPDVGIATYVGGNMFMGKPNNPNTTAYGKNGGQTAEQGNFSPSYAAEAEGTTLVAGKVINGNIKKSWGGIGFRFGTVGFGANYRPAAGSTVLAVGGGGNLTLTDRIGSPTSFLAYGTLNNEHTTGAGWAGYYKSTDQTTGPNYNMQINGSDAWPSVTGTTNKALFPSNPNGLTQSTITFNDANALSNVKIVGADRTDYSTFGEDIKDDSKLMGQQTANGTVSSATAQYTTPGAVGSPTGSGEGQIKNGVFQTTYEKYNKKVSYTVQYGSEAAKTDKLITFVGDKGTGNSPTQIFEIAGSDLSSDGHIGTAFNFTNIPDNSRIVVNVTGTDPITFHNSWRFFYEGQDISKGYVNGSSKANVYSRIASRLTWNFKDTSYLTILGGQSAYDWDNLTPTDDPAAAMLGSIYVPNGSFESHVTTNGRVYVGGDFMMYNPTKVKDFNQVGAGDGASASVIDMDQERHNFPGGFSISSSCFSVSWNKVDPDGNNLGGTSWAVYGSKTAAQSGNTTDALWTVTDNVLTTAGDYNPDAGVLEVSNLEPNRSYYIREISPNDNSYETNPNIYRINTGDGGNVYSTIEEVYDSKTGNTITRDDDKWLIGGKIENRRKGSNIQWGKYADGDTNHTGLPGSEWALKKDGQLLATITDNTKSVESVAILHDGDVVTGKTFELEVNQSIDFTAAITPSDAVQDVEWESSDTTSVVVNQDGRVTVMQALENQQPVTITAKSDSDPTKTAVVYIKPKYVAVNSLTVSPTSVNLAPGGSATLTATTDPVGAPVSWTSQNPDVATVQVHNGVVTVVAGTTAGKTTIVAKAGNIEQTVQVEVQANGTTFYIENPGSWGNLHLYAWDSNEHPISDPYPGTSVTEKVCGDWYKVHLNKKGPYKVEVNYRTSFSDKVGHITSNLDIGTSANYMIAETHAQGNVIPGTPICLASLSPEEAEYSPDAAASVAAEPVALAEPGTANTQYEDKDPRVGIFRVEGLADGTYTLQESKAPNGYWLNPQVYTIVVSGANVTWTPMPAGQVVNGVAWISDKLTEFSWDKIDAGYSENDSDATNNPLAGSEWKLEKFDNGAYATNIGTITDCQADAATGCKSSDKNHEAGKFTLKGLSVGKYRLSETKAPDGYKLPENVYYYFELSTKAPDDTSGVTWNKGTATSYDTTGSFTGASEASVNTNAAPNYRKTGNVDWNKVNSEDTGKLLPGSEWKVRFKAEGKDAFSDWYKVIDCTTTPAACSVPGKPDNQPVWTYDHHPVVGAFQLQNLEWGDYELVETKAPDGYYPSDQTYKFTVTKDNVDENINIQGAETGNKIPNTPGFELPETGGEGNTLIVLFGFALTAISMVGCAIAMRKRI